MAELPGSIVSPLVTGRVPVTGYHKLVQEEEDSEEPGSAQESAAGAGSVVLENDLKASIEVTFSGEVSLRDDASISGTCQVSIASSGLRASESFGSFGTDVAEFLRKEQLEVEREHELKQERKQSMRDAIDKERQKLAGLGGFLMRRAAFCWLLFSGLLVLCAFMEPYDWASAFMLSLAVTVLFLGMCGWSRAIAETFQHFASDFATGHARLLVEFGPRLWICLGCLCLAAAAVHCIRAGFWRSAIMPGLLCWRSLCATCLYTNPEFLNQILKDLVKGFLDEKDVQALQDPFGPIYARSAANRTIVFHGSVRPGGGPCVASWPGKYESAWDSLVKGSRKGHVSAAVVFLPEGSSDFGNHDPIPVAEGLEGSCWCVPLYGEEKPWGCRWWTKWIENIEKAVHEGAELEVYYFKGMVGKGKVKNFLTAGKEHLRREAISAQKKDFMKSQGFLAVKDHLEHLQKDLRGDSTSQNSREVQRLFLASLSEEDRSFMEASEGLGNSQKAEVAWLEKKGYAYTEVDVSSWLYDECQCRSLQVSFEDIFFRGPVTKVKLF